MSEEKDEYANNLIKHLFSKEGPCGEGPIFMTDPTQIVQIY